MPNANSPDGSVVTLLRRGFGDPLIQRLAVHRRQRLAGPVKTERTHDEEAVRIFLQAENSLLRQRARWTFELRAVGGEAVEAGGHMMEPRLAPVLDRKQPERSGKFPRAKRVTVPAQDFFIADEIDVRGRRGRNPRCGRDRGWRGVDRRAGDT